MSNVAPPSVRVEFVDCAIAGHRGRASGRTRLPIESSALLCALFVGAALFVPLAVQAQSAPPPLNDPGWGSWDLVTPEHVAEECGLDPDLLAAANSLIGRPWAVVRYGKLCHEYYPSGQDSVENAFSATKTLGAVVTGMVMYETRNLVRNGRKTGPLSDEDLVSHWLDSFSFNQSARVGHVLAMVAHNEDLSFGAKEFNYDALGTEQINRLSDILNTAIAQDPARLGRDLEEFTQRFLFGPLGMDESFWSLGLPDKNFAFGWHTTIRDMARLGLLILNRGVWNGCRLVSDDWVRRMTHPSFEDANTGYGYLTWLAAQSNYRFTVGPWFNGPPDRCSPPSLWDANEYPHGLSASRDCNYSFPWSCSHSFDSGVWLANGAGGQLIIGHPGLDMVLVGKDIGSGATHKDIWSEMRAAVIELDPLAQGNENLFCDLYGDNDYAPDLRDEAAACEALSCNGGPAPQVDDGIACTVDACDAEGGVVHTPDDSLCNNGLFCDGIETCNPNSGCQAGTPVAIGDGVACTVDSCDEAADRVRHLPMDALCDNGLFCDGSETCHVTLGCEAGPAPEVDDAVPCTLDSCDESADRVLHAPNDSLCDDTLFCNGAETCHLTLGCQDGEAPDVQDEVSCTVDSCDETADVVVHVPDDSVCDNQQFCDGQEVCSATLGCQTGTPPSTGDGVACTVDFCDEEADLIRHPPTNSLCDNGQFCDGNETCDAQLGCQSGPAVETEDGVSCTVDSCDEQSDQVVHLPDDSLCDDALFCNGAESCHVSLDCQAGAAPSLGDGVACTTDTCDETNDLVLHAPDHAVCDNGQFCDGAERCDSALDCQAGAPPATTDGVSCTVDVCDEVADQIVNTPSDSLCDNGLYCDGGETCDASLGCQPGLPPTTDDFVACTLDSCDESADRVLHQPSDALCDDALFCNGAEVCDALLDCQAGIAPALEDGVGCTVDSCDEASDLVLHTPDHDGCGNGQFCDGDEVCDVALDCQAGAAPPVGDGVACTVDSCDEAADLIRNVPSNALCDNGAFCDGEERCDPAVGCEAGPAPVIDDGVACTLDSCDESADLVLHQASDALCDDALFCNGAEVCDASLDCQAGIAPALEDGVGCTVDSCDEASDLVLHTADSALCSNGLFCDGEETCDVALGCQPGAPPATGDGVACTVDSCDELTDEVRHEPADTLCDNGLYCDGAETCDALLDCQSGAAPALDDGVACTVDSCDELTDAVRHEPADTLCDNGLYCDGAETCDALLDCQSGAAPALDDGVACTADFCEEDGDFVVHAANDSLCDNGAYCDGSEFCDPALGCQAGAPPIVDDGIVCTLDSCDEATDRVGHVPEDAACDDLDPCTADRCEATGCASSEIPGCGLPDLSIGGVVGPAAVGAGASARPEAMALDLGSSSDDIGPITISFILSRDQAVDTADIEVGNCIIDTLQPGGESHCTGSVDIPDDLLAPGSQQETLYWAACADSDMLLDEADETNNCDLGNETLIPEPNLGTLWISALGALAAFSRRRPGTPSIWCIRTSVTS